jgi:biotin carboxyl carrier protein
MRKVSPSSTKCIYSDYVSDCLFPYNEQSGESSSSGQSEEQPSEPEPKQEEAKEPKQDEPKEESAPAPSGEAETIKVPQMAESISEGTLKSWNKKVGDYVEADEEIASIETDKVSLPEN